MVGCGFVYVFVFVPAGMFGLFGARRWLGL